MLQQPSCWSGHPCQRHSLSFDMNRSTPVIQVGGLGVARWPHPCGGGEKAYWESSNHVGHKLRHLGNTKLYQLLNTKQWRNIDEAGCNTRRRRRKRRRAPWSRVLHEKLMLPLVNNLPTYLLKRDSIQCSKQYTTCPTLSQPNTARSLPSYFFEPLFNIILPSIPQSSTLSFSFMFTQSSSASCYFSLRSKYPPLHPSLEYPQPTFFDQCR